MSAIQGMVAKEQVVSSMSIIAGLGESTNNLFTSNAFRFFTGYSAYAFMVFNLFSAPCIAAIAAMRKELGSNKELLKAISFQTGLAWLLACIVYNVGTFIGGII